MAVPEKEYFNLPEIIDRWSRSKIDQVTLLDYARKDLLVFSVYIRDIGGHKVETVDEDGSFHTRTHRVYLHMSSENVYKPIKFLGANDARRILEAKDGEQIAVSVLYSSIERNEKESMGYIGPLYFEPKDLVITRNERDRFEKEFKVKTGSLAGVCWSWIADATNQRALTIIGSVITATGLAAWQLYENFFK